MVLTFIYRLGELILPTNIVTFLCEEVKAVNIFFLIQRILCFRVHG